MPTNDQDARALTYLAKRLRDETHGAARWDDAGTYAEVAKLVGQNLASVVERVTRHAADPKAVTPGAIRRPFLPDAPAHEAPRPPRVGEFCHYCGRALTACVCGQHDPRPPQPTADATTWAARIRAGLRDGAP